MAYLILWLILIIPWLSLLFMNKHATRRFMPVAILASLLVTIVFEMAYTFNWWTVEKAILPWGHINSIPLTYGVFLIGTIWIFHFTFDRSFWVYLIVNLLTDAIYSFIILNILIQFGIYELHAVKNFGIFVLMTIISLIIYAYQKWQDEAIMKKGKTK